MLRVTCLTTALLAAARAASPPRQEPSCVAGDCDAAGGAGDVAALLQLGSKVKAGSLNAKAQADSTHDPSEEALAILAAKAKPLGRTILSTDPRATAEWMLKYYNQATLVELPACEQVERAAVNVNLGGTDQLYVFIKAPSGSGGDSSPDVLIPRVEETVEALFADGSNYTAWFDNHDGYMNSVFLPNKAAADGYKIGAMKHAGFSEKMDYIMYFFPHTMYAIQNENLIAKSSVNEDLVTVFEMADCRVSTNGDTSLLQQGAAAGEVENSRWWKATFMAADPWKAMDFSLKVLEGDTGDSPYPWPPVENCTAAQWARIGLFQLHFVNSPEYQSSANMIKDYTERVLASRSLAEGRFDPYMYNSLIMSVDSLDPYVERLREHSFDFLLMKVAEEEFALFMSLPGNDIVIQLRSSQVSVAEPVVGLDSCPQQFGII